MTASNLERSLKHVFGSEGGFSTIRSDPGNWTGGKVGAGTLKGTKFGIAANTYPYLDIENLTLAEAAEIYRRDYASKVRFDELPAGLDFCVLDFAINSGPARAAIALQRVLGVADDGAIGPITLAAVQGRDVVDLIERLCDARLSFLQDLSTWRTFGKGWTSRVASVRQEALAMAAEVRPTPVPPKPLPRPVPPTPPKPRPQPAHSGGKIKLAIVAAIAIAMAIGGLVVARMMGG